MEPHAYIVLFDATDKERSLQKATNIVNHILKHKHRALKDEPIIFLGNGSTVVIVIVIFMT